MNILLFDAYDESANPYTVIHANEVVASFAIKKPTYGDITKVAYTLDGQTSVNIKVREGVTQYSISLTGLSEGKHILAVEAWGTSLYGLYPEDLQESSVMDADAVSFIVDAFPPRISVLSPQNRTYDTSDLPLNFTVNEQFSQTTYSVDGKENLTISGKTTLIGLSEGSHSLVVYAEDIAGSTGASETIHFTIAQPSEPFPTALVVGATAIIATGGVAITLGVLTHRRKRSVPSKAP